MYQSTHTGAQVDEAVDKVLASPISMMSNRNLLDNWYFVGGGSQQGGGQFPINQRGQTVYSAGDYGIDRWVMYSPSGNLQSDGLHFSANESIAQNLESSLINALNGKTVTMSVLTSDGLFAGSIVYDKTVAQYFYAQGISLVKGVGGNGSNYAQVFTSSPTVVCAAKLEPGSNQTLAHQENGVWVLNEIPNYAEELAKCQRYFWNSGFSSTNPGIFCGITNANGNGFQILVPTPVTMRAATTTVNAAVGWVRGNGANIAGASLGTSATTVLNGFVYGISIDKTSGFTPMQTYWVALTSLTVSCDL